MNGLGIVIEESVDHKYSPNQNEILLPPLPDENDLKELHDFSSNSDDDNLFGNDDMSMPEAKDDDHQFFYQNFQSSLSTYELDSPSINLDNNHVFPTISNSTTSSTKETSPLRRLKSLKKTIRKLSLSKSAAEPITSSSTINTGLTSTPVTLISDRPQVSPLQNHFKTMSQDSNGSFTTFDTKLKCHTPTTPPISSPIITLSDNQQNTEYFIQKLEQGYFDSVEGSSDDAENLSNYYNYLINEKSVINDTYNLTKNRLVKSGWCSDDDLNNLTCQMKSQLQKIDVRLNEISMKLSKIND